MSAEVERIFYEPPARPSRIPEPPPAAAPPMVEITLDGRTVAAPGGSTILDACRAEGIEVPTLCFLESLTPVNVCRVCVVEVTGSRVLVPACSRRVEPGMEVQTGSERVRHSRRMVLELLGSSVDLSLAPGRRRDDGRVRGGPGPVRAARRLPSTPGFATLASPGATTRRRGPPRRPSPSR